VRFQKVTCGKKITRDNLYVRSVTTTFEPERPKHHAIVLWMCRDVLVAIIADPTGPIIPSAPPTGRMPLALPLLQELQCRGSGFVQSLESQPLRGLV
jgi:hypothetical protein